MPSALIKSRPRSSLRRSVCAPLFAVGFASDAIFNRPSTAKGRKERVRAGGGGGGGIRREQFVLQIGGGQR